MTTDRTARLALHLLGVVAVQWVCHVAPLPTAFAQPANIGRGQLLYETACAACHDKQVHWREKRLVSDWATLVDEVIRWQESAGQSWRAEEIEDVAQYLNGRFYRFPDRLLQAASQQAHVTHGPAPTDTRQDQENLSHLVSVHVRLRHRISSLEPPVTSSFITEVHR